MKNLINYIAVFTIFSSAFSINDSPFAESRLAYPIIICLFIMLLPFLNGLRINKYFLFTFLAITVFSVFSIYVGKDTWKHFIKQFSGIISNAFFFYVLIKINNYDVKRLFKIYLNVAFIVALIGIIQALSYAIGFKPGYDYSYLLPTWRVARLVSIGKFIKVNSILPEPWHFCNVMMPALFTSMASFYKKDFKFQNIWKGVIIITAFFLSGSASGFIGAGFILLLLGYSRRRWSCAIFVIVAALMLAFFAYNNSQEFKSRVTSSLDVLTGKARLESTMTNLSTYALFSNALIAYNSFKDSPLFGSGLGSHEVSYKRYMAEGKVPLTEFGWTVNRTDANSMFIRLVSETGLFGIIAIFIFIYKFYIWQEEDKTRYLWYINNACLAIFFSKLFRMGHYFIDGFFFFFWLYYFTKKILDAEKQDVKFDAAY